MFSVLRKPASAFTQANRFFSVLNTDELSKLCRMPRIKAAMQKEGVSISELMHANIFYLRMFEENPKICNIHQKSYLSFKPYILAPEATQNAIFWVLMHIPNTDAALEKGYIDLCRDASYFTASPKAYCVFNPLFMQHLLDTKKIVLCDYLHSNRIQELYALAMVFAALNTQTVLSKGLLDIDKLLVLKEEHLSNLHRLLDSIYCVEWLEAGHLSIDQFLDYSLEDQQNYIRCIRDKEHPGEAPNLASFLSLKASTKVYFDFKQNSISIEAFNFLTFELQKSISEVLFNNLGRFALRNNLITIEQFCSLSKSAQDALTTLFYEAYSEYSHDEHMKADIARIFSEGFDFDAFDELAQTSTDEAQTYLQNRLRGLEPTATLRK